MSSERTEHGNESGNHGSGGGHGNLTMYIVGAIVLAIIMAIFLPHAAMTLEVGGQVFLRLLQMVVVPLVMASVMSGILGLGDVRKLGRPGAYAILYYMTTTVLAVGTGLIVVNIVNPGKGINKELVLEAKEEGEREISRVESETGRQRVPFTWDKGTQIVRENDGMSDAIKVDKDKPQVLIVKLAQQGNAEIPTLVEVFAKKHGDEADEWPPVRGTTKSLNTIEFSGSDGDEPKKIDLPEGTEHVAIYYQSQMSDSPDTFSRVSGYVVPGPPTQGEIFKGLVLMMFTDNLLGSMVNIDLLPLIVFSIVFAGMLTTLGSRAEIIANLVVGINDALLSFVLLLMKVAPIGIFCLVAARFGKAQADGVFLESLKVQSYYIVTVLSGLAAHAFITLPILLFVFARRNPFRFMSQMSQAILTAFSTASSTATLPVSMECAETKAGVSKRSTEFVLPLGATINMDGTALYEAAAAIFIAQAFAVVDPSYQLDFAGQATIAITATLAAIGAAGIPEAGLVTMLIVLSAVNLPLSLIGLILPLDWLLDRFRTAVNAFGDSVGAAIVDTSFSKETN